MSSTKAQFRPLLETCEPRVALSADVPANTLAVAQGEVQAPRKPAEISVPVSARNINHRHSIIIGETVRPDNGSSLLPAVTHAHGPSGEPLPVHQGIQAGRGRQRSTHAYIRTGQAGPLTSRVTGRAGTTGGFQLSATLPGDLNGDGQVTLADQKAFLSTFRSRYRNTNYLPSADANQNGQIGQGDARFLLRNLKPLTPKVPLSIFLTLAPEDAAKGPTPKTSGGKTHHRDVTILGHTTPGTFIFTDSGVGDFSFQGDVIAADAQGNFAIKVRNKEGLTNYNFLAIDPYGQQVTRVYPVYWLDFAAPGSKLK
ncbi:hypothetical protein [Singulisphaera acidiphila]|uniref:Dockerin domain-containing protein n=1 Tax=Singulisphaera acidiphila (strain ATCC BAA-1392 / DSM 18658 / VKM B-2454 / MOB10) TaxID=886293 RepID=L0DDE7_SINAD|nr:hypothetical protein [Singulisphaera acidiphila]AGA26865.1 hypothetical protein Sinac_2562 [Singulisphaera acidiphila DSM 18658]